MFFKKEKIMKNKRFEELSVKYDLLALAMPHIYSFQKQVVAHLDQFRSKCESEACKVVELGVGTGLTTERIFDNPVGLSLVGVDNENQMIELSQVRMESHLGQIDYVESDLLDFVKRCESGSVDAVVSVWTIHNMNRSYREELSKEIYRVLKVGGVFINGDKIAHDDVEEHQLVMSMQVKRLELLAENGHPDLRDSWIEHYVQDEKIKYAENEIVTTLTGLGFTQVGICDRCDMEAITVAVK
jgi:tRNA (cmo5U34)-methyltransferase